MLTAKKLQQIPIVCTELVNGFIKKYTEKITNIPLVIISIINIYYYYSWICFDCFNKQNINKYINLDKTLLIATKEETLNKDIRLFGQKIININSYLFNYYSKYILYIWKIETLSENGVDDIALGIFDIKKNYYYLFDPIFHNFCKGSIIFVKLKIKKNKFAELSYSYRFIHYKDHVKNTSIIYKNINLNNFQYNLAIQFGHSKASVKLKELQIIIN